MLSDKQFTLNKCPQIGRAHETSKQQTQIISFDVDAANSHINRITKKGDDRNNFNKPQMKCMHCGQFSAYNRNDYTAEVYYSSVCRNNKSRDDIYQPLRSGRI